MGEAEGGVIRYEIDAADRITAVGDRWLAFARENDAPSLTPEAVLGRSLWDFVAGDQTRVLYQEILRRVREHGVQIILPFRCDSPAYRRWMRLVITPRGEGSVRLDCVLERKLERLNLGILDPASRRSRDELPICSCCKRVAVESDWLEPEDAVTRLYELAEEPYPRLSHVVCEACEAAAKRAIASEVTGADAR
jgi:hypothetical protein